MCHLHTDTTTTRDSGRMQPLTLGLRKWLDRELLSRNTPTSQTTLSLVFVLHICVLAATINLRWWKSKLSCMTQQLQLHSQTLHFGHTQCTSACLIVVMETSKNAPPEATPSGKWSWTNWIVVKSQRLTNTCLDALWLTRAPTSWLVSLWRLFMTFKVFICLLCLNRWSILRFPEPQLRASLRLKPCPARSLLSRCLAEEQSWILGRFPLLDWWSLGQPQWRLFRDQHSSHSMDSESTTSVGSQELRSMEGEVLGWPVITTSLLDSKRLQVDNEGSSRGDFEPPDVYTLSS